MKSLLLLSVLAGSLAATAQAQNLVQNPNFATPTITTGNGYQQLNPGTVGSSTSPIDDFTVDDGGTNPAGLTDPNNPIQVISGGTYDGSNSFPTYPTSEQIVDLGTIEGTAGSPGGIKQTITTVAGDEYELTVSYSERTDVANTIATGVISLGTASETITATNVGDGTNAPAFVTSAPVLFTATSTSTLVDVAMTDISGVSQEPLLIQDISVTQVVSVPEPSAALPLFAACAAMGLFFWRRRGSLLAS